MGGVGFLVDAAARWNQGRERFGGSGWVGNPPLYELYEELLDAINYIEEHERQQGRAGWSGEVRLRLIELGCVVRARLERM